MENNFKTNRRKYVIWIGIIAVAVIAVVLISLFLHFGNFPSSAIAATSLPSPTPTKDPSCIFIMYPSNFTINNWLTIEGKIKNNCGHLIHDVKLQVTIYDVAGKEIKSDWVYAETTNIPAGEESDFKFSMRVPYNSKKFSVELLDWYDWYE